MGEVERYPHGTFCWIDLGTPDVEGARRFYGALLGWRFAEVAAGEYTYTVCRVEGKDVAGIHAHPEEDAPPPHWDSYISVDDVEPATARARDLGADVRLEPFELPGTARMAALTDPTGAGVNLWEARGFAGARLVNEPGTWTWSDLLTRDAETAARFYGELFAWEARQVAPVYWSLSMGEVLIGGIQAMPEGGGGGPAGWVPYFVVPDLDAAASAVEELGGRVLVPPMEVPAGRFLVLGDPQRATAGLLEMGPAGPGGGVDRLQGAEIRPPR